MNIPNRITVARVIMIPLFLVVLLSGLFSAAASRYAAAGIFIVASLSDLLDGYLARKLNQITNFGKFMDPIADKLLVSAAIIALVGMKDMAAWMAIVIVSRDFIISGIRLVAAEKGTVIAASMWAKIKTAIQMVMIVMLLVRTDPGNQIVIAVGELLKWLAVALTIISAVDYINKNKDVFSFNEEKGAGAKQDTNKTGAEARHDR